MLGHIIIIWLKVRIPQVKETMRCLQNRSSGHKDYAKHYLNVYVMCACEERNGNSQIAISMALTENSSPSEQVYVNYRQG